MRATRGMPRWNAVSKHATCGSRGRARAHRLDDRDLGREVIGRERGDAAELGEERVVDPRRPLKTRAAVRHAVAGRLQRRQIAERRQERVQRRGVVPGAVEPDAIELGGMQAARRIFRREQRQLEARRASVEGDDGHGRTVCHGASRR